MKDFQYNYNYVICGAGGYYWVGYHDVMNHPQVSYHVSHTDGFTSNLRKILLRFCFSKRINKFFTNPFSRLVYPRLYPHQFKDNKPICFLFFRNHEQIYASGYLDYLRKHYPNCKFVLYLQDIVKLKTNYTFEQIRDRFDLILSYDQNDAKEYGIHYHPTPMSYIDVPLDGDIKESDIYFCGKAKNRHQEIVKTYNYCKSLGLRCDFNIMEFPNDSERIKGINYPNQLFSYTENLQHIKKTRCILEIMQQGADGFTPRLWESIMYDCHLLSNNKYIANSPFYSSDNTHLYQNVEDVDIASWINQPTGYPGELKRSLSPLHLLQFIDKHLSV